MRLHSSFRRKPDSSQADEQSWFPPCAGMASDSEIPTRTARARITFSPCEAQKGEIERGSLSSDRDGVFDKSQVVSHLIPLRQLLKGPHLSVLPTLIEPQLCSHQRGHGWRHRDGCASIEEKRPSAACEEVFDCPSHFEPRRPKDFSATVGKSRV
jgi:hypothetical protein